MIDSVRRHEKQTKAGCSLLLITAARRAAASIGCAMPASGKMDVWSKTGMHSLELGHLEFKVLEILWERGESNVRDVAERLARPLAYTTVMTTLDRLFKKGLLDRRKEERAFLYSPRFSRREWEQKRAGDFVAGFLTRPQPSSELLISCLVNAVGERDEALLDELERRIRMRRRELNRRGKT